MKKLIFLITLTISQFHSFSQVVPSDCNAEAQIKALYQNDADRLTLRETIKTNNPWVDSVEINPSVSGKYLDALIAVYNATSLPERDTVISLLNLHANDPFISFDILGIYADTSLNWMQAYKNQQLATGNPVIDNLTANYNLDSSYAHFSGYNSNGSIYLYFNSNQNLTALGKRFESIQGVVEAQPSTYYGSPGKDIEGFINTNFVTLTYNYAWGDCPMGCMYDRYWVFKVYADCSVEFITSYGDLFPSDYISITEHLKIALSVWPNPFTNQINLENPDSEIYSYQLYDTYGKRQQEGSIKESNSINIRNDLPNGNYYLKLISKSGKPSHYPLVKK